MGAKKIIKGKPKKNDAGISLDGIAARLNMAQSRFFTIAISGIGLNLGSGRLTLPLKNMTYTMQGIDMMTVTLGAFKDIPIPVGVRIPKMSLTLTDDAYDTVEHQFRTWYSAYKPGTSGHVGYLNDLVRTLTYTSYNVDGTKNFSFSAPVMLADDYTYTRDYETNDLKTMEAYVVIVGEGIVHQCRITY